MNDLKQKVEDSIKRIKSFATIADRHGGYFLAFSGGKDSVVCKRLMDMAGVKYEAQYRVTSVDPPELVRFIKDKHPDVQRSIPQDKDGNAVNMWNLIVKKGMPPTRLVRYCCEKLKEDAGDGRFTVTGVRWAESVNRRHNAGVVLVRDAASKADESNFQATKKGGVVLVNDNEESRQVLEQCVMRSKTTLNPIVDWTDSDVWNFIRKEQIPYCSLYDEGFHRLGCIGCPMAGTHHRERQFHRWSKYRHLYMLAFAKMIEERKRKGLKCDFYETPEDVYRWWMGYEEIAGQIDLLEEYEV